MNYQKMGKILAECESKLLTAEISKMKPDEKIAYYEVISRVICLREVLELNKSLSVIDEEAIKLSTDSIESFVAKLD